MKAELESAEYKQKLQVVTCKYSQVQKELQVRPASVRVPPTLGVFGQTPADASWERGHLEGRPREDGANELRLPLLFLYCRS